VTCSKIAKKIFFSNKAVKQPHYSLFVNHIHSAKAAIRSFSFFVERFSFGESRYPQFFVFR